MRRILRHTVEGSVRCQPHGSISPKQLPQNSFVTIEAFHVDLFGSEHTFVPNQCIVV